MIEMFYNNSKTFYFAAIILLVFSFLIIPIWQSGLIVGGDWVFPHTNDQLGKFFLDSLLIWHNHHIPTGHPLQHHNLYLIRLLGGLFYYFGFSGVIFQKTLLSAILLGMGASSFIVFFKVCKNAFGAFAGSLVYVFSPLLFNYLNMGWIWVLLTLSILPIFCYLIYRYFVSNNYLALLTSSILTSISFSQAQVIFWFPLIVVFLGFTLWFSSKLELNLAIKKTFIALFTILTITTLVHLCWIFPLILYGNESITLVSVSSYDFDRFNNNAIVNLLRGWGSLHNSHFEDAYISWLKPLSFIPILFIIYTQYKKPRITEPFAHFCAILFVFPFILWFFAHTLSVIPLSNIIRDFNRFIVFTVLAFGIGTALFASQILTTKSKVFLLLIILGWAHPFWIDTFLGNRIEIGKNQPARLLTLPQEEIEGVLSKFKGKTNILLPTGSHIGTLYEPGYLLPYQEMADIDATFSPYASGIYITDKSSVLEKYFSDNFFDAVYEKPVAFLKIAAAYGLETVFIRKGLFSSLHEIRDKRIPPSLSNKCENVGPVSRDWSIKWICKVQNPYPMFYTPDKIIYSEIPFVDLSQELSNKTAVFGCPMESKPSSAKCNLSQISLNQPQISYKKIGLTSYKVDIEITDSPTLLVFNQSFNQGWVIKDFKTGNLMNFEKKLVNHLVNGWIIEHDKNRVEPLSGEYLITFLPQQDFQSLLPYSIVFLIGLMLFIPTVAIHKHYKQKKINHS